LSRDLLLVKNRALGDAIMGLGCVQYACKLYPDRTVHYLVPVWVAPLFKNVQLLSSKIKIHAVDWSSLVEIGKLWRRLSSLGDLTIHEMHQAGRCSKFFGAYSLLHRGSDYTYHNHHLTAGHSLVIDQGEHKELIQRDLDGFHTFWGDQSLSPDSYLQHPPRMTVKDECPREGAVILGVVATRETKMWPHAHFISLVNLILKHNPEQVVLVPITNSKLDQGIKDLLIRYGLNSRVEFIQVSLSELPLYLAKAHCYIGNDTGLKHLACALGIRTITLFGPEPPREWHPYNQEQHPLFYQDGLECRTKQYHYCPLSYCDSMRCLFEITPARVFETFLTLPVGEKDN
jgi:heptosyltransferase II